ncbi:MAG TPA: M14 metallopeptidase family protein [Bacteroidota bacterium]|jgi:hypothetical protein|nr:M14 metallopeptidase family protein [Bacteroidota bacterium]
MKHVRIILPSFLFFISAIMYGLPNYRADVPTPKSILGYDLGDKYTSHSRLEKYLLALRDAASDRVKLIPYGETYEGRTLYLVVVSSPKNLARLDAVKADIAKLADPRNVSDAEAEKIIASSPAIAWLDYGVHGNEASSTEAAMNVLYDLTARTDDEAAALLEKVVVVIDPLLNPDGHERYVNFEWTRSGAKPVDDRNAIEHNEEWPSGRTNHYFFDLNRDWAWLTQKESQARVKAYQEWKPQVVVDFHEMGYNSSYFFFPAVKPINKNFPKSTVAWGEIYGKANAAAFDAKGLSYWSNEEFDLYYPGYGDSWPSLNGAIGMTYEQAGQMGVRVKRNDETILTLKDRLEHHALASLATLKSTADHREEKLRDFYQFFKEAIAEGNSGPVKAFIINPEHDPAKAAQMVRLLQAQGVEVAKTSQALSMDGLHTYFNSAPVSKKFPAGSYVISLNQPAKRLIVALLEQEPVLSDTTFYDISSWCLPVAYGVETYWSGKSVPATEAKVSEVPYPEGEIAGGKATYAYVMKSNSNESMKALAWLLQHDCKVSVAMKEFSTHAGKFPRGTLIIPILTNSADIHTIIEETAHRFHTDVIAVNSGFTESGINLGSDRVVRLRKPKIIVVTSSPVSSTSYGAIWSMFDQDYGIDFTPMKLAQLRNADLHDYTAIIFPDDGSDGSGYRTQLDSGAVQKIKTWIAGGGTFIGIEGGAAFASAGVGKISGIKIKEKKKPDEKKADDKKDSKEEKKLSEEELEKRMTVEEKERKERLDGIPGTMMRVKIDNSHPLGFGYDGDIAVLKTSSTMFELSDGGYNVGMYTSAPRLSGYISKENEKLLAETPFLVHEQRGAGNIILFADDPNFRLFWTGLNRLFLNSVLMMPSIRNVFLTSQMERD